jgi:hypothetical protein
VIVGCDGFIVWLFVENSYPMFWKLIQDGWNHSTRDTDKLTVLISVFPMERYVELRGLRLLRG